MEAAYDAFISYSRRNRQFAKRLAADLEDQGLRVWLDVLEIEVGDRFRERIENGNETSRYFCLLISNAALDSYYVRKLELEAAFTRMAAERREAFILPLLYEKPDKPLPLMLASIQYLNFTNRRKYSENMQRLARKISTDTLDFTGAQFFKNIKISSRGYVSGVSRQSYPSSVGDSVRVIYERGVITRVETYSDGRLTGHKDFEYDASGRVKDNSLFRHGEYIDTWRYEYYADSGLRKRKLVYKRGDPPFAEFVYDEKSRQIEERISPELVPADHDYPYARRTFTYDNDDNVTEIHWYDSDGNEIEPTPYG